MLDRRFPKRWGRNARVEVSGVRGKPIAMANGTADVTLMTEDELMTHMQKLVIKLENQDKQDSNSGTSESAIVTAKNSNCDGT